MKPLSPRGAALAAFAPGLLFLPAALVFNPPVMAWLHGGGSAAPLHFYTLGRILVFTILFASLGALALLAFAGAVRMARIGAALARRPRLTGALFSVNLIIFLIVTLDGVVGFWSVPPPMPFAYFEPVYTFRFRPEMDRLTFGNALRREWLGAPLPPEGRPPEGARRVIMMGDSVAFGFLLAPEDSLPARLGREMGEGWEIVNAALIGFGFDNYAYYARDLAPFRPDAVVLALCLNDLSLATQRRLTHAPDDPRCGIQPVTPWNQGRWWLELHSGLMNAGRLLDANFWKKKRMEDGAYFEADMAQLLDDPERLERQTRLAAAYLRDLAAVFGREGVPLKAVILPFRFQYDETSAAWRPNHAALQEALAGACREAGIEALDLREPIGGIIAASPRGPDAIFMDYDHLRPEGSEAVARLLAPAIRDWVEEKMAPGNN